MRLGIGCQNWAILPLPKSIPRVNGVNVDNEGKTEVLIDYQSYQAGYRQAVCDLIPNQEPKRSGDFSLVPFLLSAVVMLALITFFEGA
jgi:hypothetical protein